MPVTAFLLIAVAFFAVAAVLQAAKQHTNVAAELL
jgi:hypothetical protein